MIADEWTQCLSFLGTKLSLLRHRLPAVNRGSYALTGGGGKVSFASPRLALSCLVNITSVGFVRLKTCLGGQMNKTI